MFPNQMPLSLRVGAPGAYFPVCPKGLTGGNAPGRENAKCVAPCDKFPLPRTTFVSKQNMVKMDEREPSGFGIPAGEEPDEFLEYLELMDFLEQLEEQDAPGEG